MKRKNGFTLIELIVVIAIISILSMVALPLLFKNIEKAKVTDLEADISSIKTTILKYYLDESSMITSRNWIMIYKDHDGNVKYSPDIPGKKVKEIEYIKSEIENLSIPFGYYVIDHQGDSIYLEILFDGNEFIKADKINESGIKKLEHDLGNQVKYIKEGPKILIKLM